MTDDKPGSHDQRAGVTLHVSRRGLTIFTLVVGTIAIAGVAFGVGRFTSVGQVRHVNRTAAGKRGPTATTKPGSTSASSSTTTTRPTTTTPATSTPPTTSAPAFPGVPVCQPSTTPPVIRPTVIYFACVTGNVSVTNITWQSWGAAIAVGSGTLNVNNCEPDCANGTFAKYPASIELSDPTNATGTPMFQYVSVVNHGNGPTEVGTPGLAGNEWGTA